MRIGDECFECLHGFGLTVTMQVDAGFGTNQALFDFALQFFFAGRN